MKSPVITTSAQYTAHSNYSVLDVTINGNHYTINADWIPKDPAQRMWFLGVYSRELQVAYEQGHAEARLQVRETLKELLSV